MFLVFGLLLAGCISEQEVSYEVPVEEAPQAPGEAPAEEEMLSGAEAAPPEIPEEAPEKGAGEAAPEEEVVHWDVGVTEEVDEEHRKLQAVEFDGYILIVDDITDDKPYPCAALRVGETDGTYISTLFQDKVCPGESTYWVSPSGQEYRIKVFETAAGYMGYAYWADVAVYRQS